jgi:hypothetical protein
MDQMIIVSKDGNDLFQLEGNKVIDLSESDINDIDKEDKEDVESNNVPRPKRKRSYQRITNSRKIKRTTR